MSSTFGEKKRTSGPFGSEGIAGGPPFPSSQHQAHGSPNPWACWFLATVERNVRARRAASAKRQADAPHTMALSRRKRMRIAVTADLHWGHNATGDAATRLLIQHLAHHPPDLFLLG